MSIFLTKLQILNDCPSILASLSPLFYKLDGVVSWIQTEQTDQKNERMNLLSLQLRCQKKWKIDFGFGQFVCMRNGEETSTKTADVRTKSFQECEWQNECVTLSSLWPLDYISTSEL